MNSTTKVPKKTKKSKQPIELKQCCYQFTKGRTEGTRCPIMKIYQDDLCVKHHKIEKIRKQNLEKPKEKKPTINKVKKDLMNILKKYKKENIDIIELRNILNIIEEEEEEVEVEVEEEEEENEYIIEDE